MKRWLLVGLAAAAVVLAGLALWWAFSRPLGPEQTAQAFLEALEQGDGERALELAETPPGSELDRAGALAGADELIADPRVESVEQIDGGAKAVVSFELDGEERTADFSLVETGDGWRVAGDAFGTLAATSTIGDLVTAGGVPLATGVEVALLPALYPLAAAPAGILDGSASALVLPGTASEVTVEASISPQATALAQEQLDAYAEECAQQTDRVPAHCGMKVPWGADLAALSSIAFRIDTLPQVSLSPDLTSFVATGGVIVATATGTTREGAESSFTYRADDWALRGSVELSAEGMELRVD
ncbi:hypothetical protein [Microbacterium sp. SS28]|uniref:hypothetical protein n=1 Tax=Microbacterium sp. SS28 TaxID=2919948 RepID=UPI001FA9DAA1|nr:hypothetical protein [Microbacterium sp. SS28]